MDAPGGFDDLASRRPKLKTVGDNTYISGIVSWPLTNAERNDQKLGWEAHEWIALSQRDGGATRFPLRLEHDKNKVCGRLLETTVNLIPAVGRNALCVSAVVDNTTPIGKEVVRRIESGELKGFSYGFGAKHIPGSRRYKNYMREVSITTSPLKPEAQLIVQASNNPSDDSDEDDSNEDEVDMSQSATPVPTTAAAAAAAGTAPVPMDTTPTSGIKLPTSAIPDDIDYQALVSEMTLLRKKAAEAEAKSSELDDLRKKAAEATARSDSDRAQLLAYEQAARKERLMAAKVEFEKIKPTLAKEGMTQDEMVEWFQNNADLPSGRKAMAAWSKTAAEHAKIAAEQAKINERQASLAKLEKKERDEQAKQALRTMTRAKTPASAHAPSSPDVSVSSSTHSGTVTQAGAKRSTATVDKLVAEVLGLDRFDPDTAAEANAKLAQQSRAAQQQQHTEEDPAEEEYNPPAHEGARALYALDFAMRNPNAPVPVKCSRTDFSESIEKYYDGSLPWEWFDALVRPSKHITELANTSAPCEHRYYDDGTLIPREMYPLN